MADRETYGGGAYGSNSYAGNTISKKSAGGLAMSTGGVSTVSLYTAGPKPLASTSAGQATATSTAGDRYGVSSVASGVTTFANYLGSPFHVSSGPVGVASVPLNRIAIIRSNDRFTIYASNPPHAATDVILGTKDGVGAQQGMSLVSAGQGGGAFILGTSLHLVARADGVAGCTVNRLGGTYRTSLTSAGRATMANYLSSPIRVTSTSAGRATMTDYLGSPFHVTSTSAGRATMIDYLGGAVPLAAVTHGVAAFTKNYLGSPFHVTSTANGIAHFINYIGSPLRVTSTANGVAAFTKNYLSSPFHLTSTAAGVGAFVNYLGTPTRITSTSNGRAAYTFNYLGNNVYLVWTSSGIAHGVAYLGTPNKFFATSNGRAGCTRNVLLGQHLWQMSSTVHGSTSQISSISYLRQLAATTIALSTSLAADVFKYKALAPTTINLATSLTGVTVVPLHGTINGSTSPSSDFHIFFPHISSTVQTRTTPTGRLRMQYVMNAGRFNPVQGSTTFGPRYLGRPIALAGTIRPNTLPRGTVTRPRSLAGALISTFTTVTTGLLGELRRLQADPIALRTDVTSAVVPRFGATIFTRTALAALRLKALLGRLATINGSTALKSHYTTYHFRPVDTPLGFVNLIDTTRGSIDGENLYVGTSVTAPNLFSQRIRNLDVYGVAAAVKTLTQLTVDGFVSKSDVPIPAGNDLVSAAALHPVDKAQQHYV